MCAKVILGASAAGGDCGLHRVRDARVPLRCGPSGHGRRGRCRDPVCLRFKRAAPPLASYHEESSPAQAVALMTRGAEERSSLCVCWASLGLVGELRGRRAGRGPQNGRPIPRTLPYTTTASLNRIDVRIAQKNGSKLRAPARGALGRRENFINPPELTLKLRKWTPVWREIWQSDPVSSIGLKLRKRHTHTDRWPTL